MGTFTFNFKELEQELAHINLEQLPAEHFDAARKDWLGKDGKLKKLFRDLSSVPAEEKPEIARQLNALKNAAEERFAKEEERRETKRQDAEIREQFIDLTLPGRSNGRGRAHPITRVERDILKVVRQYGFKSVRGPEVEDEFFCFDLLNILKHHPARDMQDTFHVDLPMKDEKSGNYVLRTHSTASSARAAIKDKLPIKVVSFGKVYRNETEDASHQAMFHQFDLIWIDKGLTLAHLMGLITHILKELYGKRRKVRFVPKYYPYTEPSIGPQIDCTICNTKGCPSCGGSGWVTVAGSGLLHRNVITQMGLNPDEVVGLAFGMGTSRMAGQRFGLDSLRTLYENDLRILGSI